MLNLVYIVWVLVVLGVSLRSLRQGFLLLLLIIPAYGLRVFIWGLPTNPFELSILAWLVALIYKEGWAGLVSLLRALKALWLPLALLFGGLILAIVTSPDPLIGLSIMKAWFIVPIILFLILLKVGKASDLPTYISLLLISSLPLALLAVGQVITGLYVTVDGRASGWFGSANHMSMYLVPTAVLGLALLFKTNSKNKFWYTLAILVSLVATYFSFSYGGWLGFWAGVVVIAIGSFGRAWWKPFLASVLIAGAAILSQLESSKLAVLLSFAKTSSASVRLEVWNTTWLMIQTHFLTGIGLGQFRYQYLDYARKLYSPPTETAIFHAHNLFLQFWVETGLLGLLGLLGLIGQFFVWVKRGGVFKWFLIATMVSILVHGLVDTTYWKQDLAALFWLLLGFAYIEYNEAQHEQRD